MQIVSSKWLARDPQLLRSNPYPIHLHAFESNRFRTPLWNALRSALNHHLRHSALLCCSGPVDDHPLFLQCLNAFDAETSHFFDLRHS